jgi:hypothetical protein
MLGAIIKACQPDKMQVSFSGCAEKPAGGLTMLYIVEKALDELEAMPREKREGLAHLDREINDAVEKLKILKDKLKEEADQK